MLSRGGIFTIYNGITLIGRRNIHASLASPNFMSWMRSKKKEQKEQKSTKEIMSNVEEGKDITTDIKNSSTLELINENFIGQHKSNHFPLDRVPYNQWMNVNKVKDVNQLEEILAKVYKMTFKVEEVTTEQLCEPFSDILKKFMFYKLLQVETGYLISDFCLTTLETPKAFVDYFKVEIFSGKQSRFRESEPNAIHIDHNTYSSPNVNVIPDILAKTQNKKFQQIVSAMEELDANAAKEAISKARND